MLTKYVPVYWDEISVPYNIVCTFSALTYGPYSLTSASFGLIPVQICV